MPRCPSLLRLAASGLLALALASCADTESGGSHGGGIGDVLGGVLGGGHGSKSGGQGGGGGGLGSVLGGVLGGGGGSGGQGGGLGGVLGGVLGKRTVYHCADHRGFSATFQGLGGGVTVDAEGETYQLRSRTSGTFGVAEYDSEDGNVRLKVQDEMAELTLGGQDGLEFRDCRAADQAADQPRTQQ